MGQYQYHINHTRVCNMKPQHSYYIETLTQFTEMMSSDCFRNWLSQFSVILCNLYAHDLKLSAPMFPKEEYSQKLQILLNLMPQKIKEKLIWLTPKSYELTGTPEKYTILCDPTSIIGEVKKTLQKNYVKFINFFNPTLVCSWTNCTVEDHHHSRIVARAVAMRFIDLIK